MYSETGTSNVQIQLSLDGIKLSTKIDDASCKLECSALVGCGDCGGDGAEFSYVCITSFGEALGHVFCAHTSFSVHCTKESVERRTLLSLPSGRISEACFLSYPNSNNSFMLNGLLHLAPAMDQILNKLVSSNVKRQTGSIWEGWFTVFKNNVFSEGLRMFSIFALAGCVALSVLGTFFAIFIIRGYTRILTFMLVISSGFLSA